MGSLKIPIWPGLAICAAALYFLCFYSFREPFACGRVGQSDMLDCSLPIAHRLWLQALEATVLLGAPGLIALFLARKSPVISSVWLGLFAAWTIVVTRTSYEIDGKNGCEACDFGMFVTAVAAWLSLVCAGILAFAFKTRSTPVIQIGPPRE